MQKIKTLKHVVFDILHFDGFEDFFLSIFPSLAVKNVSMTLISLSLIGGVVSKYLGLSMFMLVGLTIALLLELLLGIYVSTQIKKEQFEIKRAEDSSLNVLSWLVYWLWEICLKWVQNRSYKK